MKSSGVGNLKNPRVAGQGARKAIPPADEGTIRGMMSEAVDGTTAGADGLAQNPATAPGSHRGNIPMGVGDLMSPPGWNVP